MVDCTLTLLIRRAKEAVYLLSNEGSHRLSQGVLTTTKDLLRLPLLSRLNCFVPFSQSYDGLVHGDEGGSTVHRHHML